MGQIGAREAPRRGTDSRPGSAPDRREEALVADVEPTAGDPQLAVAGDPAGMTESNRSTPRSTASSRSAGEPSPIRYAAVDRPRGAGSRRSAPPRARRASRRRPGPDAEFRRTAESAMNRVDAARRSASYRPPWTIPKMAWPDGRARRAALRPAVRALAASRDDRAGSSSERPAGRKRPRSPSRAPLDADRQLGGNRWTDPSRWLRNVTPSLVDHPQVAQRDDLEDARIGQIRPCASP